MGFLRYILRSVIDFGGQLLTGVGFMLLLGGLVSQFWIVAASGIVMMGLGFLAMRGGD
ncbi:hypothetical protein JQC91_03355 [Jannaschia sp. Os4]|uniref:hypothetical protein n=1 Tax=Jannaschia sp. Os4 TaxID=2807617 RepID=UPI00193A06CC|nr:hypothetical protein [Jannaschia sp. Os4]MBM2575332.1 hypothetical protein [Jannaschia sp. Os4]